MTATSRTLLSGLDAQLEESMGRRGVELHPALSPVPRGRDIGRRPLGEFGRVSIGQVVPDPNQPRVEFTEEALQRLAQSIRDKGQLSPIRVRWSDQIGKWVIIAGERRWRASQRAGQQTIDCYFHEGELDRSDVLEQQLIENLLREDLKPLEEAKAFSALMQINGWNGKQLAEALRLDPSKVSRSLALLRLPPDVQDEVESGAVSARAAYELSKLRDDDSKRELAREAVQGKLTHSQAAKAVRQRKGKPFVRRRGTSRTFIADNGWKVTVTSPHKGSYHDILAALREAIDEAEHCLNNNVQIY